MACTIIKPKTHEQWLNERSKGIGSSEIGTILGLNPFESPLALWRRKMGIDPPIEESFAMKAGHYLEDAVARFYADETEAQIIANTAGDWIAVDEQYPYLRVSPDRLYWPKGVKRNRGNRCILECKTTSKFIDTDDVPDYWFCQLQYQLGVMGLKHGALAWLSSGREFKFVEVEFDEDFFNYIVEEIKKFWECNIIGKEEPSAINVADIQAKFPTQTEGKTVVATWELTEAHGELHLIKAELADIETRKKQAEEKIKMAMGDAETLTDATGERLVSWSAPKPSVKFNEAVFKIEHPDLYAQYCAPYQGARRFIVK